MDEGLRRKAVKDVLKYCRTPAHTMLAGRLLAPALLGRPWKTEHDDAKLVEAMQEVLASELTQWRNKRGVKQSATATLATDEQHVHDDLQIDDGRLTALSLTWAYYIDNITTKRLAEIASCHVRTINEKVVAGCALLAELVLQREAATTSSSQTSGQVHLDADEVGPAATSHTADRMAHEPVHFSANTHHVQVNLGRDVRVYNAPVSAPESQRKPVVRAGDQLETAVVLLITVGAFYLVSMLPRVSIGIVVLITAWRLVVHGAHCVEMLRNADDREEVWWSICAAVPWLVLLGLALHTTLTVEFALATPNFSVEHLTLIVRCIALGGFLSLLGLIDVLFWVQRTGSVSWPWRLLKSRAAWIWEQRWTAVGISWLVLLAISILWAMIAYMGGPFNAALSH